MKSFYRIPVAAAAEVALLCGVFSRLKLLGLIAQAHCYLFYGFCRAYGFYAVFIFQK